MSAYLRSPFSPPREKMLSWMSNEQGRRMVGQFEGCSALKDTEAKPKELDHACHDPYFACFAACHEPIAHGTYGWVPSQGTDGGQVEPGPDPTGPNAGEPATAGFARLPRLWVESTEGYPTLGTQTFMDRWQLTQDQDRRAVIHAGNQGEQIDLLLQLEIVFDKGIKGSFNPFGLLFQLLHGALQAAKHCTRSPRERRAGSKAIADGLAFPSSHSRWRRIALSCSGPNQVV